MKALAWIEDCKWNCTTNYRSYRTVTLTARVDDASWEPDVSMGPFEIDLPDPPKKDPRAELQDFLATYPLPWGADATNTYLRLSAALLVASAP